MVRFKNRYLLVELIFPDDTDRPNLSEGLIHSIIRESLAANFGDVGWAQVGGTLNIKYLSQTTGLMIIRTSRQTLSLVWAALTLLRSIKGVECCTRVVHVGGTIRKTQQAAIKYDRALIMSAHPGAPVTQLTQTKILQSQQALSALEA